MSAVRTEGYKATVTTADGRSISRQSLHPELALERMQDWVIAQRRFADLKGFSIITKIEPIHGKRIE